MSPPLSYTFLALLIINQGLVYYIINLIGLQLATLYLGRYKFKIYRYTYVHILTTDIPTISHWNGHSGTAVDVNHNKKFRMTAASAAPCNAWWVKISKNVQFGEFVVFSQFSYCTIFPSLKCNVQWYCAGVFPTKQVLQEMHPIWRILQLWVHKPHLLIHSGSTQFAIQKFKSSICKKYFKRLD